MRIFTVPQIKAHFIGEPYAHCPEFIGHLVQNKILIKVDKLHYRYDLSKLNYEIIAEINLVIKYKMLTYKNHENKRNF